VPTILGTLKVILKPQTSPPHAKQSMVSWRNIVKITEPSSTLFTKLLRAPLSLPRVPNWQKEFAELESKQGEKIIEKQHPSSFAQTDLDAYLKKEGKKQVVLTGYMAHVCVSTTAGAGAELCYNVVIAEDAVGNRDIPGAKAEEVVSMVINELGDAFGTVLKSSSIK
jgi:nicotinamidase-related amidase